MIAKITSTWTCNVFIMFLYSAIQGGNCFTCKHNHTKYYDCNVYYKQQRHASRSFLLSSFISSSLSFQNANWWMIGGNIRANALLANAPISVIRLPMFEIIIATTAVYDIKENNKSGWKVLTILPVKRTIEVQKIICTAFCIVSNIGGNFLTNSLNIVIILGSMASIGT